MSYTVFTRQVSMFHGYSYVSYPACPGLMYDSYVYFEKHLEHRIVFMIAPVWTNLTILLRWVIQPPPSISHRNPCLYLPTTLPWESAKWSKCVFEFTSLMELFEVWNPRDLITHWTWEWFHGTWKYLLAFRFGDKKHPGPHHLTRVIALDC